MGVDSGLVTLWTSNPVWGANTVLGGVRFLRTPAIILWSIFFTPIFITFILKFLDLRKKFIDENRRSIFQQSILKATEKIDSALG